jgi:hypothetical protein
MTKQIIRCYQLSPERIETLDDVKKILGALQLRINTDNPFYEELKEYFIVEVIPKGYLKLLDKIGHEEISKMTYEEIEQKAAELFSDEETN